MAIMLIMDSINEATPLKNLGQRIRLARARRKLRQSDMTTLTGLSRSTIQAIEAGDPACAVGSVLKVLQALGISRELDLVADPGLDREGLVLEYSVTEQRVRPQRKLDNDF